MFLKNIFSVTCRRWFNDYNKTFGVREFPVLGTINAVDADDRDSVAYQLATPTDVIIVVPQTGEVILTADPLNLTAGSRMKFLVEARDLRPPYRVSDPPAQIWLHVFRQPSSYSKLLKQFDSHFGRTLGVAFDDTHYFAHSKCIGTKNWQLCEDDRSAVGADRLTSHRTSRKLSLTADDELPTSSHESYGAHRITKRRVTRAVRPTKRIELSETDGENEGKVVFQVEKEAERETFKMREENPWISVEPSGSVRVKKKWDYEELGPEKVIDFWVVITNPGIGGMSYLLSLLFVYSLKFASMLSKVHR